MLYTNLCSYVHVGFSQNICLLFDLEITMTCATFKIGIKKNANVCDYPFIIYPRANEDHKLGTNSQYFG